MANNGWECDKGACTRFPTYALRTDRLTSTFEVCSFHVTWAIKFFMEMHGRKAEPFVISRIVFRRESSAAVPAIKAEVLNEAADRIQTRVTVQNRSEEHSRDRAVELLRDMGQEPRS